MRSKILPAYCVPGRPLESVDGVILHYVSGKNVDPAHQFELQVCRDLFLDLNREKARRARYMTAEKWPDERMYASAHLLIGRDGEIWKLVEFDREAYHAGASMLGRRSGCNRFTLGVELVGTQASGFSREQYVTVAEQLLELEAAYGFSRQNIAGHDQVRWAAIQAGSRQRPKYDPSGRKDGQGDNFDWYYLGKLMNDRRPNPEGVNSVSDLANTLEADPNSG